MLPNVSSNLNNKLGLPAELDQFSKRVLGDFNIYNTPDNLSALSTSRSFHILLWPRQSPFHLCLTLFVKKCQPTRWHFCDASSWNCLCSHSILLDFLSSHFKHLVHVISQLGLLFMSCTVTSSSLNTSSRRSLARVCSTQPRRMSHSCLMKEALDLTCYLLNSAPVSVSSRSVLGWKGQISVKMAGFVMECMR